MKQRVPVWCLFFCAAVAPLFAQTSAQSAQNNLIHLRQVMDAYHNRFPVNDDVSSGGNHFLVFGKIPANAPVTINGSWTDSPHSGATDIRCEFLANGSPFGGFYFLNGLLTGTDILPSVNFGDVGPGLGIDLTGAVRLTFWARGAQGGEQVDFFVAGVGFDPGNNNTPNAPYHDSSVRQPPLGHLFTLTTNWQQFTIDLSGDLTNIMGGFGWVANLAQNPGGAVFYLDDIQFELGPTRLASRLNEKRFLRSFKTLDLQPNVLDGNKDDDIDLVLRNTAFTYDNALALLAFLADPGAGSADSLHRAQLIGDAFVNAMQHDKQFNDNRACDAVVDPLAVDGVRLRSAYAAGDYSLPHGWTPLGRADTVPVPGYYIESIPTFYEVGQESIDVGNNAWGVIALLALYGRTGGTSYLDAACKLANFIHTFRNDSGTYQGFKGGVDYDIHTLAPSLRPWASTEHNIDVYAAFSELYRITGDTRWQGDAEHARQFVNAMWNSGTGCYATGTRDPSAINTDVLPLDVQAWSVLSLPETLSLHPTVLACAESNHLNTHDGYTGFDFNEDRDGVWFEGTAQMTAAYAHAGQSSSADTYRQVLRQVQVAAFSDGNGIVAASHDGVTTGFNDPYGNPVKYFRRLHIAATGWNVFAQLGMNPYYSRTLTVSVVGGGTVTSAAPGIQCPGMCTSVRFDGDLVTLTAAPSTGWSFASWSGACTGTSPQCVVTMSAAQSVVATFALPAPASLDAHYTGSAAAISWPAVTGAATYEVARSADGLMFNVVATPSSANANDATVVAGLAYLYRVRAKGMDGTPSAWSTVDLMTAMTFNDDPIVPASTVIRATHLTQLRGAVNAVRTLASLSAATFTDPSPTGALIRAVHVTELRTALAAALSALSLPALTVTHVTLQAGLSPIAAVDFAELRAGVR